MKMKYGYGIFLLVIFAALTALTACQDPVPTPADEAAPTPAGEAAPTPAGEEAPALADEAAPTPAGEEAPTQAGDQLSTVDDGYFCGSLRFPLHDPSYGMKYLSGTTLSWTPDGNHIIFDNRHKIMKVNAEGTRLEVLIETTPRTFEQEPPKPMHQPHASLSRDGKKLAYSSCQFTSVQGKERDPDLPLEVDEIVLPRGEMHFGELAVADSDGSNQRRLTEGGFGPSLPAWSPDGTKIALIEGHVGSGDYLAVMNADGSDLVPWSKLGPTQTEDPSLSWEEIYASRMNALVEPPAWSPDSSKILVRGRLPDDLEEAVERYIGAFGRIYKLDLTEGRAKELAISVSAPAWSPDGERIAYTRMSGGQVWISTMSEGGNIHREIIKLGTPREYSPEVLGRGYIREPLKWSPDGRHILFSCEEGLCVTNMHGRVVGKTPESLHTKVWDGHLVVKARLRGAWSPDGQRIAVRGVGFPQSEGSPLVYTMKYDGTDVRVLVRGGYTEYPANVDSEDGNATIAACRQGYVVPQPQENWGLVQDCEILGSIRNQLRGDRNLNWTPGTPLEDWRGVIISGAPPRVTGLKLTSEYSPDYSISGILPPTLAELDQLERVRIDLQREHSEVIPTEWEKLDLEHLDIRNFDP